MKRILLFVSLALVTCAAAGPFRYPWKNKAAPSFASFADDFERANANPISNPSSSGGTWQSGVHSIGNGKIDTGRCLGSTSTDNTLRVASPTFSNQQYAEVQVANMGATYFGPCVRIQGASLFSCYALYVNNTSSVLSVAKFTDAGSGVGPSNTPLGSDFAVSLTAGDTIRIAASGTTTVTLSIYVNGSLIGTRTDSTSPLTGGQPGFYSYNDQGSIFSYAASDF